jgi:hypothetical protein
VDLASPLTVKIRYSKQPTRPMMPAYPTAGPDPGQRQDRLQSTIDLNTPRTRARAVRGAGSDDHPDGFTVADPAVKVHAMTGQTIGNYTVRQAAYDLRKLYGSNWSPNPAVFTATKSHPAPPHPSLTRSYRDDHRRHNP